MTLGSKTQFLSEKIKTFTRKLYVNKEYLKASQNGTEKMFLRPAPTVRPSYPVLCSSVATIGDSIVVC